ncbi:MAG: hypothetical protein QOJ29_4237, partial [Thermoleophilaceae bacterium]|nr:hypothetical protein [Thermoleophilaceae bacterium]
METTVAEVLMAGPLKLRPDEHLAVVSGHTLKLTRNELGLLIALV